MAVMYGFFNAIDGDRTYDAEDMSRFFDGIFTDGIFLNFMDSLSVVPATGMNVTVNPGRAWFDHTWTYNPTSLTLSISGSDQILPRIDAVVIDVNKNTDVRANDIKIVRGTPATVPERPILINELNHKQYPIAYITVGSGVSEIGSSAITDNRGTSSCPYASSIIDNVEAITQNVYRMFLDTYQDTFTNQFLDKAYPIGSIYMSMNNTDPTTIFGGTWEALKDRFLVGAGGNYTVNATGGADTVTLNVNQLPSHSHSCSSVTLAPHYTQYVTMRSGSDYTVSGGERSSGDVLGSHGSHSHAIGYTGSGQAIENRPLYRAVYMWKRVA